MSEVKSYWLQTFEYYCMLVVGSVLKYSSFSRDSYFNVYYIMKLVNIFYCISLKMLWNLTGIHCLKADVYTLKYILTFLKTGFKVMG